jgi:hypothetical protein
VDVVHAGSGLARIAVFGEFEGDLHGGAGGFEADDIGVEVVDGLDDVAELGVAHVGVDLGVRAYARGGEAERLGGPRTGRAVRPRARAWPNSATCLVESAVKTVSGPNSGTRWW